MQDKEILFRLVLLMRALSDILGKAFGHRAEI
jgi:hypothetical protein